VDNHSDPRNQILLHHFVAFWRSLNNRKSLENYLFLFLGYEISRSLEVELESHFIQFYKHDLDQKLHVGDKLVRIVFSNKMFSIYLYGKLGWEFVGKNDISFNIRIKDTRIKFIRSENKKEVPKADDLRHIYPL